MATTLFTLLAKLGIDTSDYTKGLDDAVKHAEKSSSGIVKGLSTVGAGVVVGLAAAAGATTAFLATTISPARDLAETVSKVGVVFGDEGDAMLAWAKDASTAMGMTQNQALAAAGTYGNLFRAMDMSESASADMSTGLVELSADLASFNNMDPGLVLEKLRAGLSGETEPLKSLGVNINAAMLEAKALEMGLWDGESAITAAAKAQASYALIMEQTSLAQGDFARTSEGLANQQRITAAVFGDIKATLGTALLPAMTALQGTINGIAQDPKFQEFLAKAVEALGGFATSVIEAIPKVIETFQTVSDWLSKHQGVIIGILVALGAAVAVFGYTVAASMAPAVIAMAPIIATIVAIGAVVALLYEAWDKDWGGIRTTLTQVWEKTLKPIFETIKQWLGVNIPVAIDALTSAFNWVKDNVLEPVAVAFGKISTAIGKVIDFFGSLGAKFNEVKDMLPDWMVPGSPTPFELGLLGIAEALGIVERASATAFSALEATRGAGVSTYLGNGYVQPNIQPNAPVYDAHVPQGMGMYGSQPWTEMQSWVYDTSRPPASTYSTGDTSTIPAALLPDLSTMPDLVDALDRLTVETVRRRKIDEVDGGRAIAPTRDINLTIYTQSANPNDIQIGVLRGLAQAGVR